jgi:hypothetical protein
VLKQRITLYSTQEEWDGFVESHPEMCFNLRLELCGAQNLGVTIEKWKTFKGPGGESRDDCLKGKCECKVAAGQENGGMASKKK